MMFGPTRKPLSACLERLHASVTDKCPACGCSLDGFEWGDSDTLTNEVESGRFDAMLDWGNCPRCNSRFYSVKVCVVPKAPEEFCLLDDNCWESPGFEIYRVWIGGRRWTLGHFHDVRGVTYCRGAGEQVEHDCAWLDRFTSAPFLVPLSEKPWDAARLIAEEAAPAMLALCW